MHPKFVPILRCPVTGSELTLSVEEYAGNGMVRTGTLTAADGVTSYPVINGVPRFVSAEHYSGSFGYEWRRWPRVQFEASNDGKPMAGHTARMFRTITGWEPGQVAGSLVLEFGCGSGRFLDQVRGWGGLAVGLDMSAAVDAARENFAADSDVLIVQGDVLAPPLRQESFDLAYSIGVLHHTPDPAAGLANLVRLVRPGGSVACCVYPKGGLYDLPSVRRFRRLHAVLCGRLGRRFATGAALVYSYFAAGFLYHLLRLAAKAPGGGRIVYALETRVLVNVRLPDLHWRVLDVFDAITPHFASTHTAEEVRVWFAGAGCTGIRQTDWCATSFVAQRGAVDVGEGESLCAE